MVGRPSGSESILVVALQVGSNKSILNVTGSLIQGDQRGDMESSIASFQEK